MIGIVIVIAIVAVLLTLVVLAQNPKGGGLSQTFGGVGNQLMGFQKTTDILEKATWTLAIALLVLSLATKFVVKDAPVSDEINTETFVNPDDIVAPVPQAPAEDVPAN